MLIFIISFILFVSGCISSSYKTFNNDYMSFEYPAGWNTQEMVTGGVHVFNVPKEDFNNLEFNLENFEMFSVTPYISDKGRTLNNFNNDVKAQTEGHIINTDSINGITYSYTESVNSHQIYYFTKNGKGVIIDALVKDPKIIENVIKTFN